MSRQIEWIGLQYSKKRDLAAHEIYDMRGHSLKRDAAGTASRTGARVDRI